MSSGDFLYPLIIRSIKAMQVSYFPYVQDDPGSCGGSIIVLPGSSGMDGRPWSRGGAGIWLLFLAK